MLFVNPWGCKPWRGQRLGSVLANRLTYIEANCCNLSGEKGIEEKFNREGAWTMDCLGLLLGGGWAFRLTGSKGSSKGSKGLWKCRGTTKGKVDSKNKEGLVATSCGNVSAMVSFCQDADEAKWNDEKLEACVELSCLICSIWWYMQQLFLSQVAAEKASADAVALSAEAHHLKCWQTKSLQCPVYFCRMLLPLMPRTLFHVCGYVCLCVCVFVFQSLACLALLWKLWKCNLGGLWCPNGLASDFGTVVCCQACGTEEGQQLICLSVDLLSCPAQHVQICVGFWSCKHQCFWIRNLRNLLLLCVNLLARSLIMHACFVNVLCMLAQMNHSSLSFNFVQALRQIAVGDKRIPAATRSTHDTSSSEDSTPRVQPHPPAAKPMPSRVGSKAAGSKAAPSVFVQAWPKNLPRPPPPPPCPPPNVLPTDKDNMWAESCGLKNVCWLLLVVFSDLCVWPACFWDYFLTTCRTCWPLHVTVPWNCEAFRYVTMTSWQVEAMALGWDAFQSWLWECDLVWIHAMC